MAKAMPLFDGGENVAYSGWLIKAGDYKIPHSLINAETYQVTITGQDLDSYEDANGLLHRNALKLVKPKVEFETKNLLTDDEMWDFLSNIRSQYIGASREKKLNCTFYAPELHKYITHLMYMPDITFIPYIATSNVLKYKPTRIAFISYGEEV